MFTVYKQTPIETNPSRLTKKVTNFNVIQKKMHHSYSNSIQSNSMICYVSDDSPNNVICPVNVHCLPSCLSFDVGRVRFLFYLVDYHSSTLNLDKLVG